MQGTAKFNIANLEIPGVGNNNKSKQQQLQNVANQLVGDPQPQTQPLERVAVVANADSWMLRLWAPFTGPKGFLWPVYLRTLFLVFIGAWTLSQVVTTVHSYSTAPSVGQNAILVALAYGLTIAFFYSWRQADRLPIHLHTAVVGAEWIHGHLGAIVAIPYMGMHYLGSLLSAATLVATQSSAIQDFSAAARPASFWGAAGINMMTGLLFTYTLLQNSSVLEHLEGAYAAAEQSKKYRGFSSYSVLGGIAAVLGVLIGYGNGMYSLCNPVVYFGAAFNIGFNLPVNNTWTIDIFMCGLVSAAAWALHLLTWNVQGLSQEEFDMAAAKKDV